MIGAGGTKLYLAAQGDGNYILIPTLKAAALWRTEDDAQRTAEHYRITNKVIIKALPYQTDTRVRNVNLSTLRAAERKLNKG